MDERSKIDEIRHHMINGLLVIRGLCDRAEKGRMSGAEAWEKIRHRAEEMEQALEALFNGPKV